MKTLSAPAEKTLADVIAGIGGVPLGRIRASPSLGTATEADVIRERKSPGRRLCELVDGILVEKPMGAKESILACELIHLLSIHVRGNRLGVILGEAGMLQLFPGRVRIPHVSFIPWDQTPRGRWPDTPPARPRRGSPRPEQYSGRDAPEDPGLLPGGHPPRLGDRPEEADRAGPHGSGRLPSH